VDLMLIKNFFVLSDPDEGCLAGFGSLSKVKNFRSLVGGISFQILFLSKIRKNFKVLSVPD
jgi:hypothetical protein